MQINYQQHSPRKEQQLLTYRKVGVDRFKAHSLRKAIAERLDQELQERRGPSPIKLPFGLVVPLSDSKKIFFDFQTEGVGTKTLLAELIGHYESIGVDGVAMAVNDVIRSGARPILLSDCIHISKSSTKVIQGLIRGIIKACGIAGCSLVSGETGIVPDILHHPLSIDSNESPFDLVVSCVGLVSSKNLIRGRIEEGDEIIGVESSGIHSNGITLARRVLLKRWGGAFETYDKPLGRARTIVEELLIPTRIYSQPIMKILDSGLKPKAAIHITGDGFAKFSRLSEYAGDKLGFRFELCERMPPIFGLIYEKARARGNAISIEEMYRTFNMGYGFAIVSKKEDSDEFLQVLNKYFPSRKIGLVTAGRGIRISGLKDTQRTIISL